MTSMLVVFARTMSPLLNKCEKEYRILETSQWCRVQGLLSPPAWGLLSAWAQVLEANKGNIYLHNNSQSPVALARLMLQVVVKQFRQQRLDRVFLHQDNRADAVYWR